MLSSIFSSFGGFVGKLFGGGIFSTTGRFVGKWIGDELEDDDHIEERYKIGKTKDNLYPEVLISQNIIPLVFGKTKINGKLIWCTEIKEVPIKESGYKYLASKTIKYTEVEFIYYCSFAIGICEGEILSVDRVWANGELLDLSRFQHKIYLGSENQEKDPTVSLNNQKTPAYRGLAYIVFKDFPLIEFRNNIPSFSFEVERMPNVKTRSKVAEKIKGINIIPGSGEFVYDTIIQSKKFICNGIEIQQEAINCHNRDNIANSIYSLNYLKRICPNVEWVAPVVCWFGNNTNIKDCDIYPAVETKGEGAVYSEEWRVAELNRATAKTILKDSNDNPLYGGTVNDNSVVRYLQELKKRGLKVMFYPMIFMDIPNKPWRGHLTGSHEDVVLFFNKPNGYRNFILHYARLVKDYVDVFLIGSEMKGLTSIRNGSDFPAVEELLKLAAEVKAIVGSRVKVSYAADWSEYHHEKNGWYHLDKLWASSNIDFVGIDNYMPLSEVKYGEVKDEDIIYGFDQGEGYDYYYSGEQKEKLAQEYAWKNVKYWWSNYHTNPDGVRTEWIPKSKKIWFTEYGFASIDKSTNQPNVFYDPNCIDGNIPKNSNGNIDFGIQRRAIEYFIDFWGKEEYVENMFLWCFDARPYPEWPHSKYWRDYYLWDKGHWINGKIGNSFLGDVILEISHKVGLDLSVVDVSMLEDDILPFSIENNITGIELINLLRNFYFFDLRDNSDSTIHFIRRGRVSGRNIDYKDLLPQENNDMILYSNSDTDRVNSILIKYKDVNQDYLFCSSNVFLEITNKRIKIINTPFSSTSNQLENLARNILAQISAQQVEVILSLPIAYIYLKAGDNIEFEINKNKFNARVTRIEYKDLDLKIICEIENDFELSKVSNSNILVPSRESKAKILQIFIPKEYFQDSDNKPFKIFLINVGNSSKNLDIIINQDKVISLGNIPTNYTGILVEQNIKTPINYYLIDEESYVDVAMRDFELNQSHKNLQNSSSLIKVGERILHYGSIQKLSRNIYRLSKFIFLPYSSSVFNKGDEVILLEKMKEYELENIDSIFSIKYLENGIEKAIIL